MKYSEELFVISWVVARISPIMPGRARLWNAKMPDHLLEFP